MWDTFRPLRLTTLWHEHEDPGYAYSWNPDWSTVNAAGENGADVTTATGPSA
jgi:hypothetical protein